MKFDSEAQTRALFFKKLDWALKLRHGAYGPEISSGKIGKHSFRLCFGESDGLPGLIIDLFEGGSSGVAVIQGHSAGSDQLIFWTQQWLMERMGIDRGVIRNDLEVRKREGVKLEVLPWGGDSSNAYAIEGGLRFNVDPLLGQKTGYFYDHRDNRRRFAEICRNNLSLKTPRENEVLILDCFSFSGSWGLQVLSELKSAGVRAKLIATDISKEALECVKENAKAANLLEQVECVAIDFFKDARTLSNTPNSPFDVVACDPPSLTSSAKNAGEGKRAHESCFRSAIALTKEQGLVGLASCSFHLKTDDFLEVCSTAAHKNKMLIQDFYLGFQSADHPVLSSLPESRYLKAMIGRIVSRNWI